MKRDAGGFDIEPGTPPYRFAAGTTEIAMRIRLHPEGRTLVERLETSIRPAIGARARATSTGRRWRTERPRS